MFHFKYVLFNFIFMFLMERSNQHHLGIFVVVYLGIFIIIIIIRIWFINYLLDPIIIFRGILDKLDDTLSEIPGDDNVRIFVLIPHGKLEYGHPYPIPYLFTLKIDRVDGLQWIH